MLPPTANELSSLRTLLAEDIINTRTALLVALLGQEDASCQIGSLADDFGISIPRVSMLSETMVRDGLVDRVVPASDQRKTALALTQRGYEVARHRLGILRGFTAAPH